MKFLWVLLALLISSAAIGQADLLTKKKKKYFYKNKQYKCEELDVVYQDHLESLELFYSGKSTAKAAGVLGYLGLGFIGLGAGVAVGSDTLDGAVVGALSIMAGLLLEVVALIPLGIGNRKLKKAMRTFNYEMIERHGYQEPSLSFGMTRSGVGLVYQF